MLQKQLSPSLAWGGGGHPAPTHSGLLVPLCPIWLLSHQHPFSTRHWEWEKTGALPSQLACKDDYANATMVAGDLGAGLPHGAPRTALALQRGADTHPWGHLPWEHPQHPPSPCPLLRSASCSKALQ